MPLSEDEQRILSEIEQQLYESDPALAREVAKKKITVNCVSPGFIATELIEDLPEEVVKRHKASVPLRRFP